MLTFLNFKLHLPEISKINNIRCVIMQQSVDVINSNMRYSNYHFFNTLINHLNNEWNDKVLSTNRLVFNKFQSSESENINKKLIKANFTLV